MKYKGYDTSDFEVIEEINGHCGDCFFASGEIDCTAAKPSPFIKSIFKQHPNCTHGSCLGLNARLKENSKTIKTQANEKEVCNRS